MKKVMSLRKKELFKSGFLGITWIIMGGVRLFNINGIVQLIVSMLLVVVASFSFMPRFVEAEQEDEMAEFNMYKAKSNVYDLLLMLSMIIFIIIIFTKSLVMDFNLVIPFLLGGMELFKFISFIFFEKVGD